jgi:competence protein ComEA
MLRSANGEMVSENGQVNPATRAAVSTCLLIFALVINVTAQSQNVPKATPSREIAPEARVDINLASLDQLLKVPGMTRPWAERIIRFRPYRAKNEIVDRGVVTSEVYARIKDYIIAHRSN